MRSWISEAARVPSSIGVTNALEDVGKVISEKFLETDLF